ncbi:hypothetical protein O166_20535 [Pseudogulbenkiania ferrooxidans EGD-HP2]|uniref:Uncharacterized protein n=1 Tax=Pseudogulbenkiania ferrooxidans EGD-HP2 TaxID=1388764 RepID=A0ABP2XRA7_9NEIS|nr:hypothetical protein O166_20535 [Pseudogulbenkiania ferrooxidans EGD-HP2]
METVAVAAPGAAGWMNGCAEDSAMQSGQGPEAGSAAGRKIRRAGDEKAPLSDRERGLPGDGFTARR